MKSAYDEIMEHIEVTPEMRRRVLKRLREERLSPSSRRFGFTRYLPAACLALLLIGAALLPRLPDQRGTRPPLTNAGHGIEEAASLRELSGLVGFEIEESFTLPFAPDETSYASFWRSLAQIEYSGEGQSALFRKSPGAEDNSGDFTSYSSSLPLSAGERAVTLKGDGGLYVLALWTDGGFACSLRLSSPVTAQEWQEILAP